LNLWVEKEKYNRKLREKILQLGQYSTGTTQIRVQGMVEIGTFEGHKVYTQDGNAVEKL
jgi:hypothetical protein